MIEVVTTDGRVWVNPRYIVTIKDWGATTRLDMHSHKIIYVKDTTAAKLARRIAGSDI